MSMRGRSPSGERYFDFLERQRSLPVKLGGIRNRNNPALCPLTPPVPEAWKQREEIPLAAGQTKMEV